MRISVVITHKSSMHREWFTANDANLRQLSQWSVGCHKDHAAATCWMSSVSITPSALTSRCGISVEVPRFDTFLTPRRDDRWQVLTIRGTAAVEFVNGAPEYAAAAVRYLGEEQATTWANQAAGLLSQWARIRITPAWVGILDFDQRLPGAPV